jgi:hypothetical protein
MRANICFMARPNTPASTMFPATDPVNEDSTNRIDLVTKVSATIDNKMIGMQYKRSVAGVGCRFELLG